MLGWSIRARACRSASNRAITCLRVHAQLDDLQGHLAADRLLLLGHVDVAEAAFADQFQELVAADRLSRLLGDEGGSIGELQDRAVGDSRKSCSSSWTSQQSGQSYRQRWNRRRRLLASSRRSFRRPSLQATMKIDFFVRSLACIGFPCGASPQLVLY